ncbi:MAG TPA: glycosyltransferase family 2 protein [Nitrospira sp.]|nr:glycosyltransferase family 2 protein [Nitrospira sp.]
MKISVIIPAYNEEHTIAAVIQRVQAVPLEGIEKEIIVVDDASTDRTAEVLDGIRNIRAIRHEKNEGKGSALATGIDAASGDVVIFQDADLEYAPEDYPAVLQPLIDGCCDAVMGSRFLRERPVFWGSRKSPYLNHYIGNLLIIWVTNILYGKQFTDYEGCYKAFRRSLLVDTPVQATGFEFDNELICKVMRKGARIVEVPIQYHPRTYAQGKKITWRHGLVMLWTIVQWRIRPLPSHTAGFGRKMAA